MLHYFAYGSEMRRSEMEDLVGHALPAKRARLLGYRLAFTAKSRDWGGGVADIVRDEEAEVEGVLFELGAADALRLDVLEGFSDGLKRKRKVVVEAEDGAEVEALTFHVADKRASVAPSAMYLDAMIEGASEHGLSETYVTWLLTLYPDPATVAARSFREEE